MAPSSGKRFSLLPVPDGAALQPLSAPKKVIPRRSSLVPREQPKAPVGGRSRVVAFKEHESKREKLKEQQLKASAREKHIREVFEGLDVDQDGRLSSAELRQFAALMQYAGDDEEWAQEYRVLAADAAADARAGITKVEFTRLLAKPSSNCFCTDDEVAALAALVLDAKGAVDASSSGSSPTTRAELILDLFHLLDKNQSDLLEEHELEAYAVLCGFPASGGARWDEFPGLCQHYGWDAAKGVTARQFEDFVNDERCPIRNSDYSLLSFLKELRPAYVKRSNLPHTELLHMVFLGLSSGPGHRLAAQDMRVFAEFLGYQGDDGDWMEEFDALSRHYGWGGGVVSKEQWMSVVSDADSTCRCTAEQLRWILAELQFQGRLPCSSASFFDDMQRAAAAGLAERGLQVKTRQGILEVKKREAAAHEEAFQRSIEDMATKELCKEMSEPRSSISEYDLEAERTEAATRRLQKVQRGRATRFLQERNVEEIRRRHESEASEGDDEVRLREQVAEQMGAWSASARPRTSELLTSARLKQLRALQLQQAGGVAKPGGRPRGRQTLAQAASPKAPTQQRAFLYAISAGTEEEAVNMIRLADAKQLSLRDVRGCTALHLAAQRSLRQAIAELLGRASFALPDAVDAGGWSALHHAAKYNQAGGCLELLAHPRFPGADEASHNAWGWTALHRAAFHGHLDIVYLLLSSKHFGAMNSKDKVGRTALHVAATQGHLEVALAISGCPRFTEADALDDFGQKAISLAMSGKMGLKPQAGNPFARPGVPEPEADTQTEGEDGEEDKDGADVLSHVPSSDWAELWQLATFISTKYRSLKDAFDCIDVNDSRLITRHELVAALQRAGFQGNVGALWQALDLDRDGLVSLSEFMHMVRPFVRHISLETP